MSMQGRITSTAPTGPLVRGVMMLEEPGDFGASYNSVRGIEGRLLDDALVAQLPMGPTGAQRHEWRVRERSAHRLVHHLAQFQRPLKVLDVGCGNGWMSAMLSRAGHEVLGIDRNLPELQQAARVFPNGPRFALAAVFNPGLDDLRFDVVLFAASFQYFADVRSTMERALTLAPDGEVHVMDSVLYPSANAARAAEQRTKAYYARIGVPGMADHYHCHMLEQFYALGNLTVLDRPRARWHWKRILGVPPSPFTHVVVSPK